MATKKVRKGRWVMQVQVTFDVGVDASSEGRAHAEAERTVRLTLGQAELEERGLTEREVRSTCIVSEPK